MSSSKPDATTKKQQHQSSLDSFFGVPADKKVKTQKTLTSFFRGSSSSGGGGAAKKKNDKENSENENDDSVDVGTDDTAVVRKRKGEQVQDIPTTPTTTTSKKRESPTKSSSTGKKMKAEKYNSHRPIIDDDDDSEEEIDDVKEMKKDRQLTMKKVEEDEEEAQDKKTDSTISKQVERSTLSPSSSSSKKRETTEPAAKVKKESTRALASSKATTAAASPASADAAFDTPERRKLVARAKKIAKAYKVEPDISDVENDDTLMLESPVQYQSLVQVLDKINDTTKRLEIQSMLTKFLRQVLHYSPTDINAVVYLASNSVAPAYDCVELGIGDSILIKAIAEAYGSNDKFIKSQYKKEGDLGTVAQSCKSKQKTLNFAFSKPKPLLAGRVLSVFRDIANTSGSKSQKMKIDKIKQLLVAVQHPAETKYIIRGLQGKLRIGLAESTVLISLAHALCMTVPATVSVGPTATIDTDNDNENDEEEAKKSGESSSSNDSIVKALLDESLPVEKTLEAASSMIRKVYSEAPSYDELLVACLKVPLVDLHKECHFQPGIPVVPMLAKPTKSIQEVLKRLDGQEFTCEFKYDGERAQIHKTPDGTLKVFSRNMLETSAKYPEVPLFVQEAAEKAYLALQNDKDSKAASEYNDGDDATVVDSFVLDAEVVAFNQQTGQLVPFQVLSTRKKELENNETAKVQVIVQAFDLMYLNGKSLLATPLRERRRLLTKYFAPVENKFQFATALDVVDKDGDTSQLEQFLDQAVKGKCEGLMVKTMDDVYEPSRRSLNWLKLKKDYLEGLGDSFDLVVLGAYYGRGKRTGVYGAYLLACYDEDSEEFQSVCKIGTGFSDEDLQSLSTELNKHKLEGGKSSQYVVSPGLECDVWFDAVQVWEIKAADLSKSNLHRGAFGKLEEGRGIGLRFPRFERVRDDKAPEQATNSDQILEMYYNQDTVKDHQEDDDDDDGI